MPKANSTSGTADTHKPGKAKIKPNVKAGANSTSKTNAESKANSKVKSGTNAANTDTPPLVSGGRDRSSDYVSDPKHTLPVADKGSECMPGIEDAVCMSDEAAKKIEQALIKQGVDQKDLPNKQSVIEHQKKQTHCPTEECVLMARQTPLTEGEIKKEKMRFKPKGPADSNALLHNVNIDTVLKNWTVVFDNFYHMTFQMIDFAGEKGPSGEWLQKKDHVICPTALGKINMVDDVIKKGFKTFAVVLNTDTREKNGEHWFCLFCDFRSTPFTIEYFNSSGRNPYKQIQDWMAKAWIQINNAGYVVVKKPLTGMIHQKDSETECGPYSLYYIYNRLKGVPAENFQGARITDAQMLEFRKNLFAKE